MKNQGCSIIVYDILGKEIMELWLMKIKAPGFYEVRFRWLHHSQAEFTFINYKPAVLLKQRR